MPSTTRLKQLSSLALMRAYKDTPIDTENLLVREYYVKKSSRLAFEL